jgi:hypothetical protein
VSTEADSDVADTEVVESEGSRKGAESRIRELNARAKQAEIKAKSLEDQVKELTQGAQQGPQVGQPSQFDRQPPPQVLRPGEEIDYNEYERRQAERDQWLLGQMNSISELKTKQSEAITRINNESQEVMKLYPELDPDSDSFDRELSESVSEATLSHIKSNPYSASPKEFVTKLMKPYKRSLTKQVGKASENIAKQMSQAAQRPTAVSKHEKDHQDKSIRELEEELGIVY